MPPVRRLVAMTQKAEAERRALIHRHSSIEPEVHAVLEPEEVAEINRTPLEALGNGLRRLRLNIGG